MAGVVRILSAASGEVQEVGRLTWDGARLRASPDGERMRTVLSAVIPNDQGGWLSAADGEPWLRELHTHYTSVYLCATELEEHNGTAMSVQHGTEPPGAGWLYEGDGQWVRPQPESIELGLVGDVWHGPTPPGKNWSPIAPGPRGGKRWKRTGAPVPQSRAAQASRPSVGDLAGRIKGLIRTGLGEQHVRDFGKVLGQMTVKDIHELKKQLGLQASGNKAALVQKILERAKKLSETSLREPEQETAYERGAPQQTQGTIQDRLKQYTEGDKKVAYLAGLRKQAAHYGDEIDRTREELNQFWKARENRKTFKMGKKDKETYDRLNQANNAAWDRRNQAWQEQQQALAKFAASAPSPIEVDLGDYMEDAGGAAVIVLPQGGAGQWPEPARQTVDQALSFVGNLLENKGFDVPQVQVVGEESIRSHYVPPLQKINLGIGPKGGSPSTCIHELGHHLENTVPGVREACRQFLAQRTAGQQPKKFKDLYPDRGYRDDEEGIADDFAKAFDTPEYVGKVYATGDTEILSMGLQKLHDDPARFAEKDPEYCKLILGILDGSLR